MSVDELFTELHRLNRAEKLRVIQVLVMDLVSEEEALIVPGTHYEIWSPYDAPEAAQTLLKMLEAEENESTSHA